MNDNIVTYIFISEDYLYFTDLNQLKIKDSKMILITRTLNNKLSPKTKSAFDKIIVIKDFSKMSLLSTLINNKLINTKSILVTHDEEQFIACAEINNELDIYGDSLDEIRPFVDKVVMKERLYGSSVKYPEFIKFDRERFIKESDKYLDLVTKNLSFPLIIKPTNQGGCRGVTKAKDFVQLKKIVLENKDLYDYEIEEFVECKALYHCDSVIMDGQVICSKVMKYLYPVLEFGNGKPVGSYLISELDPIYDKVVNFAHEVILSYKKFAPIPNCVTHLELFETDKEELVFLEIAARCGGGDIKPVYLDCFNLDIEKIYFQLKMNQKLTFKEEKRGYGGWVYYPKHEGKIVNLFFPKVCSQIMEQKFYVKINDCVNAPKDCRVNFDQSLVYKVRIFNEDYNKLLQDMLYLSCFTPALIK